MGQDFTLAPIDVYNILKYNHNFIISLSLQSSFISSDCSLPFVILTLADNVKCLAVAA